MARAHHRLLCSHAAGAALPSFDQLSDWLTSM
jgi:hypothetical protein